MSSPARFDARPRVGYPVRIERGTDDVNGVPATSRIDRVRFGYVWSLQCGELAIAGDGDTLDECRKLINDQIELWQLVAMAQTAKRRERDIA